LIITGAAGPGATIMMAGSLSVKMSFVGLALATACHGMSYTNAICNNGIVICATTMTMMATTTTTKTDRTHLLSLAYA